MDGVSMHKGIDIAPALNAMLASGQVVRPDLKRQPWKGAVGAAIRRLHGDIEDEMVRQAFRVTHTTRRVPKPHG